MAAPRSLERPRDRLFEAADEQGRQDMANRLLADHIELAGAGEAGVAAGRGHIETAEAEQTTVAAGSEIVTLPERRIEEIAAAMIAASIHQRIPPAARIQAISVGGDLDHILVDIRTTRPGTAPGSAEIDRTPATRWPTG